MSAMASSSAMSVSSVNSTSGSKSYECAEKTKGCLQEMQAAPGAISSGLGALQRKQCGSSSSLSVNGLARMVMAPRSMCSRNTTGSCTDQGCALAHRQNTPARAHAHAHAHAHTTPDLEGLQLVKGVARDFVCAKVAALLRQRVQHRNA
jgi:hypothetical protein